MRCFELVFGLKVNYLKGSIKASGLEGWIIEK